MVNQSLEIDDYRMVSSISCTALMIDVEDTLRLVLLQEDTDDK
jgi:hypothetical protein